MEEENKEPKGRWLGGDPSQGYATVGQMPGAPGINDAAIFAEQRKRNLQPQQFDLDDPHEIEVQNMMNQPEPTAEDYTVATRMEAERQESLRAMESPAPTVGGLLDSMRARKRAGDPRPNIRIEPWDD